MLANNKQINAPVDKSGLSTSVAGLLAQAKSQEANQDYLGAKAAYLKLINDFSNSKDLAVWTKKLEDVNVRILFSSIMDVILFG